jgi:fatty acid amide hydrolase 2
MFQLKSETLVRACIDRINEVQPLLNVVDDHRFDAAVEEARKVDRILSSLTPATRKLLRDDMPFLGVPFSVGSGIRIKGFFFNQGSLTEGESSLQLTSLLQRSIS